MVTRGCVPIWIAIALLLGTGCSRPSPPATPSAAEARGPWESRVVEETRATQQPLPDEAPTLTGRAPQPPRNPRPPARSAPRTATSGEPAPERPPPAVEPPAAVVTTPSSEPGAGQQARRVTGSEDRTQWSTSPSGIAALVGLGGLVAGSLALGTDEESSRTAFAVSGLAVGLAGFTVSLVTIAFQ